MSCNFMSVIFSAPINIYVSVRRQYEQESRVVARKPGDAACYLPRPSYPTLNFRSRATLHRVTLG